MGFQESVTLILLGFFSGYSSKKQRRCSEILFVRACVEEDNEMSTTSKVTKYRYQDKDGK